MSSIAVIPARGGSKRIPRKNIKPFAGKPIIAWSIQAAIKSGLFSAVLVSTDDDEIAAVARAHGAEAPFRRPPELSGDSAPTLPVVAHAIRWFEAERGQIDRACCIYATAPSLRAEFLKQGFDVLESHPDADFAFSVTTFAFPIFRALKRNPDGSLAMFWPGHETTRSQDLPDALHDAGQFYWGRRDAYLNRPGIYSARSFPVLLPRHMVQDIDTPEDWEMAEQRFAPRDRHG